MKAKSPLRNLPSRTSTRVAEIVSTAQRLRAARKATRQFLLLWSFEQSRARQKQSYDADIADPNNHDWSQLYLGSVLDD